MKYEFLSFHSPHRVILLNSSVSHKILLFLFARSLFMLCLCIYSYGLRAETDMQARVMPDYLSGEEMKSVIRTCFFGERL